MTLIISEVSKYGIAMVADSAVTQNFPPNFSLLYNTPVPPSIRVGVQKVFPIPEIKAGISAWGFGSVGMPNDSNCQIPLDQILKDFTERVPFNRTLVDVGNELVNLLNPRIDIGRVRGGLHLAGYVDGDHDEKLPVLYHIHTGHSQTGPHGPLKLYRDFPYESGMTETKWLQALDNGYYYHLRNGQFDTYAMFADYLNQMMEQLTSEKKFICPFLDKFEDPILGRGKFLELQIKTIAEYFRLSNREQTIAMPVSLLTISPKGNIHYEPIKI